MGKTKKFKYGYRVAIILFIVSIIALIMYTEGVWVKRWMYPLKFEGYIVHYSREYDLDPYLVASVVWVESRFRPEAVSRRDARGLMQVTPGTGRWGAERIGLVNFDDELLYDPETNIQIGCWYLNNLTRQFGDNIQVVLAAYNGGSGNVTKWLANEAYSKDGQTLEHIPFKETRVYVSKVVEAYDIYREIYPGLGH